MKKVKVEKGVSDNAPSSEAAVTTGSATSQWVDCASSRPNLTQKTNDFGFSKSKNTGLYKRVTDSKEFSTRLYKRVKNSKPEENLISGSKED